MTSPANEDDDMTYSNDTTFNLYDTREDTNGVPTPDFVNVTMDEMVEIIRRELGCESVSFEIAAEGDDLMEKLLVHTDMDPMTSAGKGGLFFAVQVDVDARLQAWING